MTRTNVKKQRKTSKVKKSIIGEQVAKLTKNVKVVLTRDSVFAAVSADQPKISHNHKMITRSKKQSNVLSQPTSEVSFAPKMLVNREHKKNATQSKQPPKVDAVDAKESAKSESTNTEKPTIHTEKVAESGELVLYQRFDIGDILWARMRGFPLWPAKIVSLPKEKNMVDLIFYGDRTRTKMFKTALLSFDDGLKQFKPGKRPLLEKAVKEALYEKQLQVFGNSN